MKRTDLVNNIKEDLSQKMVFLGGPRQVGKTTIAYQIMEDFKQSEYLNWDHLKHRQKILDQSFNPEAKLIVFDEIHKYKDWKNYVKGQHDVHGHKQSILVTGSARLDIYRKGGDSLMGRYHYRRLHPFSVQELESSGIFNKINNEKPELNFENTKDIEPLLKYGGFPEPFLSQDSRTQRRWQKERFERVIREDIRDTSHIIDIFKLELLAALLPERVASPLSYQSLSEDLSVSASTIKSWIESLRTNYFIYQVPPYHKNLAKALKKESKFYMWDWSVVESEGARFENMISSHLLKYCHYLEDQYGFNAKLYYIRDTSKREVDFMVTWQGQPWFLVECKLKAKERPKHLIYYKDKLKIKQAYLVTRATDQDYIDAKSGIRIIPAGKFLTALA